MARRGVEDAGDALLLQQRQRRVNVHLPAIVVGFDPADGEQIGVVAQAALGGLGVAELRQFQPGQRRFVWACGGADAHGEVG